MNQLITLNLGNGNFYQGFPFLNVIAQSGNYMMQSTGNLPAMPELWDCYKRWQSIYQLLYQSRSLETHDLLRINQTTNDVHQDSSILINKADIIHISETELSNVALQLKNYLDYWLSSEGFQPIERNLRQEFNSHDQIRFIIQSRDQHSRQLPWYIWRFFQDYPYAEVALSAVDFKSVRSVINPAKKVRVLAILGNSAGIDIATDRALLENLEGAHVVFLVEPSRQQLDESLWDRTGWDILFFAGHSQSNPDGKTGEIYINPTEQITIAQLKNALNHALKRGLQLAIFNSCQGLGLANQLSDLQFPQMILMREPVPDRVAQIFLKNFLSAFSQGQSLYLSFREARERLQGMEGEFPGASWLPLIFQNPAEMPPTWNELSQGKTTIMSNTNSNLVATLTLNPSSQSQDHSKTQQYFLSSEEVTVIGRSPDCHISLNPMEYVTVSRHHAEIKHIRQSQTSGWQIRDTGTTNGTLVNDQQIEGWHPLNTGDRVTLGHKGPELIFEHSTLPTTVFVPVSATEEKVVSEPISESQVAEEGKAISSPEASPSEENCSPSDSPINTKATEKATEAVSVASVQPPSPQKQEATTKAEDHKSSVPEPVKNKEAVSSSCLWEMVSQQELSHLSCSEEINALAFSPDGTTLASASGDKTIKLWHVETGEEQLSITAHKLAINALAFSPDGTTLASASGDKTIKLWHVETGEEQLSISTQKSIVSTLIFSPHHQLLASISDQRSIKLWSIATAEEVLSITLPTAYRGVTILHPSGQTLASAVEGDRIAIWKI